MNIFLYDEQTTQDTLRITFNALIRYWENSWPTTGVFSLFRLYIVFNLS